MTLRIYEPGHNIITDTDDLRHQVGLIEVAGRTCYKSEDKIREGSAADFIGRIVRSGHESVIEHGHAMVRITGDRAMTHQLVRHRLCEYSQESQRYCDYGEHGFGVVCQESIGIIPPGPYSCRDGVWQHDEVGTIIDDFFSDQEKVALVKYWLDGVACAYSQYLHLREKGIKPQDARSLLPNATKTEIVMTANFRVWRHIFKERGLNPHAQWQIRGIMFNVLRDFAQIMPEVFGDLID